ncbi:hypothetical protein GCM10010437_087790 [Actinoplanes palleronii]
MVLRRDPGPQRRVPPAHLMPDRRILIAAARETLPFAWFGANEIYLAVGGWRAARRSAR